MYCPLLRKKRGLFGLESGLKLPTFCLNSLYSLMMAAKTGKNFNGCFFVANHPHFSVIMGYGGSSSVVSASEFKSEDPGFEPLARQGERRFFCPSESTSVQTCWCLTPLLCVWHAPKFVRTLKIRYP